MASKFPIYPYFCPLNGIILGRLIKKKENIQKSKIFFFGSGVGYQWEVGPIPRRP